MQSTWLIQFDTIRFDSIHCETNHHFVFAVWWNQHHVTMYKTIKFTYLWICNEKKAAEKEEETNSVCASKSITITRENDCVEMCVCILV